MISLPGVGAALAWLKTTQLWVTAMRWFRQARLWVHRLTRDEGLAFFNLKNERDRAAKHDPELGGTHTHVGCSGHSHQKIGKEKYGIVQAGGVILLLSFLAFALWMIVHTIVYSELPPMLAKGINELQYSRLLHASHDPLAYADNPQTTDEDPKTAGPYRELRVRTGMDIHNPPPVVSETCRRLSRPEIQDGTTAEGYVLPLLMMRMCELAHEMFGCEEAGVLLPKNIETSDNLNICLITFKEKDGVCHHFLNPTIRPILSSKKHEVTASSPHFFNHIAAPMDLHSQALMSYQPIVHAQIDQELSADAVTTRALSNAYDALPLDGSQWLPVLPSEQTITVRPPLVYYYTLAYSALLGEYPAVPLSAE